MRLRMLLGIPLLLALSTSCAELAGLASADAQPHDQKPDDLPTTKSGNITPTSPDQPGSTPNVDGGSQTGATTCGTCILEAFTSAKSIDDVVLTPQTVLVGDATASEIFECKRNDPTDCWTITRATGVGASVGNVDDFVVFFAQDNRHVYACTGNDDCGRGQARDLGAVTLGSGSMIPPMIGSGERVFWGQTTGVVASFMGSGASANASLGTVSRLAAFTQSGGNTTLVGATTAGAWAVTIGPAQTIDQVTRRDLTNVAANDVAVDAQFIWIAQNDGLYRAKLGDTTAARVRAGSFSAVAASRGIAWGVTSAGDLIEVRDNATDLLITSGVQRVWADAVDAFVYYRSGTDLKRVAR